MLWNAYNVIIDFKLPKSWNKTLRECRLKFPNYDPWFAALGRWQAHFYDFLNIAMLI